MGEEEEHKEKISIESGKILGESWSRISCSEISSGREGRMVFQKLVMETRLRLQCLGGVLKRVRRLGSF